MYTLLDVKEGETAAVIDIKSDGTMKLRLLDLGLIRGTDVKCIHKRDKKSMSAYLIRGALIGLRAEDASKVQIADRR